MKRKFAVMLVIVALLATMFTSAMAVGVSARYENGVVYWTGIDLDGMYDVYVDGTFRDSIRASSSTGQWTKTFEPGTYTVVIKGASGTFSTTFTVAAPTAEPTAVPTAVPTAEPTAVPTAEPTVEPTAVPTAEPTVEPTAEPTVKPTAKPTVKPTAAPDDADDEVPKTGYSDAGIYVVLGLMAAAAVYLFTNRKVHSH